MIPRILAKKIKQLARKFPAIAITGPRQSGKTVLVQNLFPKKPYVLFEDPDIREFATNDPRGFLQKYPNGAIFDEAQRVPELFSYLQGIIDKKSKAGMFILTGSQQFLLLEKITQTLAGRIAIVNLLPFSLEEIKSTPFEPKSLEDILFKGMYPRLYDKKLKPLDLYPQYVQTYIERDVRSIKNIGDLTTFQKFIKLCAGRTGQLLNLSSLANDCGITHNTAKSWISILEASFIVYLLCPHHANFNKRLIKSPKLYFYDTGLVCYLLGIENKKQIETHPLRGNIFETFIMSELIKFRFNLGLRSNFYFWQDKTGNEIDCIYDKSGSLIPIEIKSTKTIASNLFKNLHYWNKISKSKTKSFLIYGGDDKRIQHSTYVVGWREVFSINKMLA